MKDDDAVAAVAMIGNRLLGHGASRGDWETLKCNARSIVLRGHDVIVKQAREDVTFNELAALRYMAATAPDFAPSIVAFDEHERVVAIEDLGDGLSLADALTGDDESVAVRMLDEYVDALAELHQRTRVDQVEANGGASWPREVLETSIEALRNRFVGDIDPPSDRVIHEIRDAASRLFGPGRQRVFSFGDMCPDNNVRTENGLRFFDLEGACHVDPAADLAYLTVPFPTCWCCFDLPAEVRSRLVDGYVEHTGDHDVRPAIAAAHGFFGFVSVGLIGRRVVETDEERVVNGQDVPSGRTRVLHRVGRAADDPLLDEVLPLTATWLRNSAVELATMWPTAKSAALAPAFAAWEPTSH